MKTQHTPGPWIRRDAHLSSHYIDAPGKYQLIFLGASTSIPKEEHEANANLVAAAPDMLEALEIAMDYLPHITCEWATKARSAIAKAKGESQ